MTYKFKCVKCDNEEYKTIAIDKYDELKNKQVCSKCGNHMERLLEFGGSINLSSGMYGIDGNAGWNS